MFSKISNRVRDWMNRTEPPLDHQQAGNSINDQLNALSIHPENETKVDANKNGNQKGSNSEERDNVENLQAEKEGGSENERKFEVVGLAELERIRSASFPARSEAEDCSHVHQVGANFKTNQPADWKPQNSGYAGGSDSAKSRRANRRRKTSPKLEFNFMGLPIRPGEKDCSEFMSHGSCESGVDCRFNHPDPTSLEGSDGQSGHSNEGPIVSPGVPQTTVGSSFPAAFDNRPPPPHPPAAFDYRPRPPPPAAFDYRPRPPPAAAFDYRPPPPPPCVSPRFPSTLGFSSPPAFDNCPPPPSFPLRFPSNLGPSPPVAFSQCPPYAPMMFPPTQGVPCWPENAPYQAPVHLPESFMQMPSVYATNNQPPERNFHAHERPQKLVDEFPQRPGQPECSYFLKTGNCMYGSSCIFHHPKNRSAKPTASGHRVSGPTVTPPPIPESVVQPSRDASFSKKFVGQNSGLNAHKIKPKEPKATLKKGSSNSSVRCDLCGVECPDIQNYNNHLTGKKHTSNLQLLHASRTSLEAKPGESMEAKKKEEDSGSEVVTCGKGTQITNVASDLEANIQKNSNAIEMGPSTNLKGSVTCLETDFEAKTQESCSAEGIGTPGGEGLTADTSVGELEEKKQKLLESGIGVQSLRTCVLCNVVCNGETAFTEHLRGKKHLAKCEQHCSLSMQHGSCKSPADCRVNSPDPPSVEASDSQSGHCIEGSVVSPNASQSKPGSWPLAVTVSRCPPNIPLLSAEGVLYWSECSYSLKTGLPLCGSACKLHHPGNNRVKSTTPGLGDSGLPLRPEQDLDVPVTNLNPASVTNLNPKPEEDVNKKTNTDQFVWCEVCKVRCTSLKGLMHHEQGKKHKKNMEKSQTVMTDPTSSPSKDSGVDCWLSYPDPISDVQSGHSNEGFVVSPIGSQSKSGPSCPGVSQYPPTIPSTEGVLHWPEGPEQLPYEEQVLVAPVTNSDPASVTNPSPKSAEEVSKKTSVNLFVWCELCKVRCPSISDLKHHERGKKHKNNEETAKKTSSTPPTSCEICKVNFTSAEDLKNHKYGKKHRANVEKLQENPKMDPTLSKDLEAKKQKVLEHGVAADAVKICIYCNVVCTSEKMYNNHVAGPKHVAAVLKLKQVAESGSWTELPAAR